MMKETRTTLATVPSGKIELVFNGIFSTIQYNCSCTDALPWCHAMCCRLRMNFTVILRPEEIKKFENKPLKHNPQLRVLQDDGMDCVYLDDEGRCEVHESGKPWTCRAFHCSPGGVGEGVEYREGGWLLSPKREHEVVDDKGTVLNWNEVYARSASAR